MDKNEFLQQVDEAINAWEKERLVQIVNEGLESGMGAMEIIHEKPEKQYE